ncbi:MAG: (2Fe-2S)-binding protein [Thermaerobacter sp.]|nr:(2Fe-2S)-binding protein [Thermaerobacter sp.]
MAEALVSVTINGRRHALWGEETEVLLTVLRDRLGLTGTKNGCEVGHCGACAVWVDGLPQLACLTLLGSVADRTVTTVEGLAGWWRTLNGNDAYHPLQTAFVDNGAVQCGFCTPGMLMAGAALVRDRPGATAEAVRESLAGHLCRCTGYEQIVRAVLDVAAREEDPA